jgi:putative membrane protein
VGNLGLPCGAVPSPTTLLVAAHVFSNVVWIGSILSVAMLVGRARFMADSAEVGGLALRVYNRLAVPAFLGSFVFGLTYFVLGIRVYAHMPWMHAKLTLAVGIIALHHMIGARAKRAAAGKAKEAGGTTGLLLVTLVLAAGVVWLAVAKQLP